MGVVYRARDPRINREVALKAIPLAAEFEGDELEEARTKFFREAEMAGRLSHPHIVTIHDAGRGRRHGLHRHGTAARPAPGRPHGPGAPAAGPASRSRSLPASPTRCITPTGSTWSIATSSPRTSCTTRPSGELKITDFGIARLTDSNRTRTGVVLGTPSFMSPEQLQGRAVTGSSDLFSLAVTACQLLTGQLPFRADSMPALMIKIAHEPHPPIRALRPDLPAGLDALFDRALAKTPADRIESGAAFASALRDLNTGGGT